MRKGITKEQVINKALELMKDKEDISSINLRVIAREVGCAHTNLYNYFSSFDDLLGEAYIKVLDIFANMVIEKIVNIEDYQLKLRTFFTEIVDFYLDNKGWFRLLWVEILGNDQKEANYIAASKTVDGFVIIIEDILKNLYLRAPKPEQIKNTIHVVHCYIYGEISIYIAKHSFIQDETNIVKRAKLIPITSINSLIPVQTAFKNYIVEQAIKIFNLYLEEKE